MQEGGSFGLERFEICAEVLLAPTQHRAYAQSRFATAGLRPASAKRNGNTAQQCVRKRDGIFFAVGLNNFGDNVRGVRDRSGRANLR